MSGVEVPANFCPVPWMESFMDTAGHVHLCCIMTTPRFDLAFRSKEEKMGFFNSPKFVQARKAILNNERLPGCNQCWKLESIGLTSGRMEALERYKEHIPAILEKTDGEMPWPRRLDMRYSPKCNLQCKMCAPHASDQVYKLVKKLKNLGVENTFTNRGQEIANESAFMTEYVRANPIADSFFFAGGEPFIMPEFHTFLDDFIAAGRAPATRIHILTNLTAVHDSMLDKMVQFREIDFSCSMDGAGWEFEYQRWPSRWEKVKANFEKVLLKARSHKNLMVTISPCITHLNVRSLGEFLEFLYDRDEVPDYNGMKLVMDEDQLDHRLIPMPYRPAIVARIRQALDRVGAKMPSRDFESWSRFADTLLIDHVEMTEDIAIRLQDAVLAWDFEKEKKWRELYPWADELLRAADKFRSFRTFGLEGAEMSVPKDVSRIDFQFRQA